MQYTPCILELLRTLNFILFISIYTTIIIRFKRLLSVEVANYWLMCIIFRLLQRCFPFWYYKQVILFILVLILTLASWFVPSNYNEFFLRLINISTFLLSSLLILFRFGFQNVVPFIEILFHESWLKRNSSFWGPIVARDLIFSCLSFFFDLSTVVLSLYKLLDWTSIQLSIVCVHNLLELLLILHKEIIKWHQNHTTTGLKVHSSIFSYFIWSPNELISK